MKQLGLFDGLERAAAAEQAERLSQADEVRDRERRTKRVLAAAALAERPSIVRCGTRRVNETGRESEEA
jgi:hypothetical protein